ncbi:MAG: hypothetical protein Q8S43_06675, partial [Actinomycetota bacterium]|nr:hypothetical protein [Actinomycetota bacterium]
GIGAQLMRKCVRKARGAITLVVLRCTRKLLDRVGVPLESPPQSSSRLGDWYAKPFQIGRKRFILLMSGTSRLPVVMLDRDVVNLGRDFPDALGAVLSALGVPDLAAAAEVELSREFVYAATDSRSMLGSLNDFALMAQHRSRDSGEIDVVGLSVELSGTPIIAMNFGFPRNVTLGLLANSG